MRNFENSYEVRSIELSREVETNPAEASGHLVINEHVVIEFRGHHLTLNDRVFSKSFDKEHLAQRTILLSLDFRIHNKSRTTISLTETLGLLQMEDNVCYVSLNQFGNHLENADLEQDETSLFSLIFAVEKLVYRRNLHKKVCFSVDLFDSGHQRLTAPQEIIFQM